MSVICAGEKRSRHRSPEVTQRRPWYYRHTDGTAWASAEYIVVRYRCKTCGAHWERKERRPADYPTMCHPTDGKGL